MQDWRIKNRHRIDKHGQDTPEIRNLKWMESIGNNAGQKSFETQSFFQTRKYH
jgi:hypothetical protein